MFGEFLTRVGRDTPAGDRRHGDRWPGDLGWSGVLSFFGIVLLVAMVTILLAAIRPPTVEEVERDIWMDWARLATDTQGRTLIDQVIEGKTPAGQRMLETLGRLIDTEGSRFVVRTSVAYIRVVDPLGQTFAEWRSPSADEEPTGWRNIAIELRDPVEGRVGTLLVGYRFYSGGLEHLPNIRRLQQLHRAALWLVGILASVTLFAVLANISRIRERAARLQSQQVTLDLAHQMCHELRNGLWAFSLESKNLRELFGQIDVYLDALPDAQRHSLARAGVDPALHARFERFMEKQLVDKHVDPQTDLRGCNDLAREAHQQIESFTQYLNLTVDELDRHLVGVELQWDATRVSLHDAWADACQLLAMRLRGAAVAVRERRHPGADVVVGDRRALVHSFVNLIKNAIEAMQSFPDEKRIEWSAGEDDGHVVCQVCNVGATINERDVSRIFEPGFSTKAGKGRGTGLTLVRQSVQRMGGTIRVTTVEPAGTCFELRFPHPPS